MKLPYSSSIPKLNFVTTALFLFCCDTYAHSRLHDMSAFQQQHHASSGTRRQPLSSLGRSFIRHEQQLRSLSASFSFNRHHRKPSSLKGSMTAVPSSSGEKEERSKRKRFLNTIALKRLRSGMSTKNSKQKELQKSAENAERYFEVKTVQELEDYFNDVNHNFRTKKNNIDYDSLLASLIVKGNTQKIGSPIATASGDASSSSDYFIHNVQKILHDRRHQTSTSSITTLTPTRQDNHKIALVVEGGGMRGCVTAGMVTALYYLGLEDTFDVIYGSSAGTVIGAYFNTRQLPFFGPEIYYDSLTTADKKFIDTKRLLRCVGLGLADPRLMKDVVTRPEYGKPVLNLDFLLRDTMQLKKPLNWDKFVEMQRLETAEGNNRMKKRQPLKVVSSGLHCGHSVVLDYENGGFGSIEELASAMRSSCLLPGIAGPIVNVKKDRMHKNGTVDEKPKYIVGNNVALSDDDYEPLADALIFEPLPYKTAIDEGATHVVMLRSKPDGADVTGKTSMFEKMIFHRFFKRKNKLSHIYKYMRRHGHKKLYAKQVIELNEASNDPKSNIMAIAIPPGSPEVTRLETGREAIFEGVRRGFARAYDCLVEDPRERGRGEIIAKRLLPDEILDYDPLLIDSGDVSAFEHFLSEKEGYEYPPNFGETALQSNLPR